MVPRPSSLTVLFWLLLPACASVLLLAATNKLCHIGEILVPAGP